MMQAALFVAAALGMYLSLRPLPSSTNKKETDND